MATQAALSQTWTENLYRGDSSGNDHRSWKVQMISRDQVLEIDLRTGSVTTLLASAQLLSLDILQPALEAGQMPNPLVRRPELLAVRTAEQIFVFDAAEKAPRSYVIPENLRGESFTFYELRGGTALVTATRRLPDHSTREELSWIDSAGKVVRRQELALAVRWHRNERAEMWEVALAVPVPVAWAFAVAVIGTLSYLESGAEPDYASALKWSVSVAGPPLLAVCLLAAVLAWFCHRRHRRFALPWGGIWVVFVFLGGVPGLLAYFFHRRWPVMEACPACGRDVPHDREACSQCGKEFSGPEPKGIEVFA